MQDLLLLLQELVSILLLAWKQLLVLVEDWHSRLEVDWHSQQVEGYFPRLVESTLPWTVEPEEYPSVGQEMILAWAEVQVGWVSELLEEDSLSPEDLAHPWAVEQGGYPLVHQLVLILARMLVELFPLASRLAQAEILRGQVLALALVLQGQVEVLRELQGLVLLEQEPVQALRHWYLRHPQSRQSPRQPCYYSHP
jgi:hypothetical protein